MKTNLYLTKSEALEAAGTNFKSSMIDDRTNWEAAGKNSHLIPSWCGELQAVEDEEGNRFAWFYDEMDAEAISELSKKQSCNGGRIMSMKERVLNSLK